MSEFLVLDYYCIECDDSLEDDEKHKHPFYDNEVVCKDCHGKFSSMSFQEFEDLPVDEESHPIDWMVDETDEEYFDHEA